MAEDRGRADELRERLGELRREPGGREAEREQFHAAGTGEHAGEAGDPASLAAETVEALHARVEGEADEARRGTVEPIPPAAAPGGRDAERSRASDPDPARRVDPADHAAGRS